VFKVNKVRVAFHPPGGESSPSGGELKGKAELSKVAETKEDKANTQVGIWADAFPAGTKVMARAGPCKGGPVSAEAATAAAAPATPAVTEACWRPGADASFFWDGLV
jgi:hypothetical protein